MVNEQGTESVGQWRFVLQIQKTKKRWGTFLTAKSSRIPSTKFGAQYKHRGSIFENNLI